MNAFEKFLLTFVKAVVIASPSVAPIFLHSSQGVMIFNASEALSGAMIQQFTPGTAA